MFSQESSVSETRLILKEEMPFKHGIVCLNREMSIRKVGRLYRFASICLLRHANVSSEQEQNLPWKSMDMTLKIVESVPLHV